MANTNIIFTEDAARKVYHLMSEEDNLDLKLRVYVNGGGCSGFQYGFTFDESIEEDDTQVCTRVSVADSRNNNDDNVSSNSNEFDVTLLIDAISYPYLKGATIDYREDVQGAQFVIKNPNAKTTCGCGASFAVADEGDSGSGHDET